jgi:dTMP kinase
MYSKKGRVIVIEGCDGSGKATQTQKLYERLTNEGYKVKRVEYPNYNSESSALVKMYLSGLFGKRPQDVNAYVASTFYAVDRFASYKMDWQEFYLSGGIIIADRYTTANMIHQASKIDDLKERDKFLDWVWEFEFKTFGLPMPDCVVFLDMHPKFSRRLMAERVSKMTGNIDKDIHEKNYDYLIHSYNISREISEKYNWLKINCIDNNTIKTIDKIHNEIYENLQQWILNI